MDINEALNLIAENLEDESVKRFMQPILDKYFSKGLATWKENHLPEEILKAMAPLETEEAKRIRSLQQELDNANRRGELERYARSRGLNEAIVDLLPADKDQALKLIDYHLEAMKNAVKPIKTEFDTYKALQAKPGGGSSSFSGSLEDIAKLPPAEMLKALESNPGLLKSK